MSGTIPIQNSKPMWALDYQPKNDNWLGRNVKWLKKDEGKATNFFKTVLLVLECVAAIISLVGIYFLVKGKEMSDRIDSEKRFKEEVKSKTPPSPDIKVERKTAKQTFNHVQEFVIQDDVIWERGVGSKEWKAIYFDGFSKGEIPTEIHADGANLVVLDQNRTVHYKKILHEYRRAELEDPQDKKAEYGRKMIHVLGKDVEIHSHPYVVFDKAAKNNWKDKWFSLPFLSDLVNLFEGKRIKIPADVLAWGISHRGRYNDYYEDKDGRKHLVGAGVTTLYVLLPDGKGIWKYDPWSPPKADMNISVTDTSTSTFEALNLSPSASTLMLVGYESTKDPEGGTKKTLKIKTRLADIDTEGWNPGLKYNYVDPESDKHRLIGFDEWQEHPLPPGPITKEITILQTGAGNNARQMRVTGEFEGQKGEFYKDLQDKEWQFMPFAPEEDTSNFVALEEEIKLADTLFESEVADYETSRFSLPKAVASPEKVALKNFGKYSTNSTVKLQYAGKEYELILHRKKTLKNFIGIKGDSYDLINLAHNPELKALFPEGKWDVNVKVRETHSQIVIKGANFSFKFNKRM